MSRRVELVIETLALEGIARSGRDAIASAVTAELGRLLAHTSQPRHRGEAARRGVATVRIASTDPAAIGTAIAHAVHRLLPDALTGRGGN